MGRGHRDADPAFGFDPDDQCTDEVASAHRPVLRQCQDRRGDRRGWMNRSLRVGVVEIEHMGAYAVEQRGVERVHPLRPAEQRRLA
jgi:hypothetical protein